MAQAIVRDFKGRFKLAGIFDSDPQASRRLSKRFSPPLPILSSKALIGRSRLLIEAASPKALQALLPEVIRKRCPLLAMSAGGLLAARPLVEKARKAGVPILVPSGALAGLDGIKAARIGTLRSVTLTTRKPPASLSQAPGIRKLKINLNKIKKPVLVFEGPAKKAALLFPQNINVAATLALAGLGADKTRVKIFADPTVRSNIHEVEAVGSFGKLFTRCENVPSKENPKTSRLAVYSAVSLLKEWGEPIRIGT